MAYLLNEHKQKIGVEFCAANLSPMQLTVDDAFGVEVQARSRRKTYFASLAGHTETTAKTMAQAMDYDFGGGTNSPFVVCGSRDQMPQSTSDPAGYAYEMVSQDQTGKKWVPGLKAIGTFYAIQGSVAPGCGVSQKFDGLADPGVTISQLPTELAITPGNKNLPGTTLGVAGLPGCAPTPSGEFNGCGMLIPMAVGPGPNNSSSTPTVNVVAWGAFQLWGSGNNYTFTGSTNGSPGESCKNPITNDTISLSSGGGGGGNGGGGNGGGGGGNIHVLTLAA